MGTKSRLIAVLKAEVGYHEGFSGGHWNNHEKYAPAVPGLEWAQDQPWCATFAVWAYETAKVKAGTFPVTASVRAAMDWYKAHKRWSEYPSVGAQVIYGEDKHTGIVISFDATHITTIEGNTNTSGSAEGDGVYLKVRARADAYVTGYGSPDFDPEVASTSTTIPKPTPVAPPFPGRSRFVLGANNSDALTLQTWLSKIDAKIPGSVGPAYTQGPSKKMTAKDIAKVKAFQQHFLSDLGPADGGTGPKTWKFIWEVAFGHRNW